MTDQPMIELNDGRTMPQLGFGTYKIDNREAANAVRTAIEVGYRLVDTASIYRNEQGVGEGMTEGVWLTTKVWNDDQGRREAPRALEASLERLGRSHVDLLLIHWPCPDKRRYLETWQALIALRDEGLARSIGVSNFMPEQIEELVRETGVVPAVNQVECHPRFQQRELRALHERYCIVTQSWSPLGQGGGLEEETVQAIAREADQSPAAVLLRWHVQKGLAPIPKASSQAHMEENFSCLSFTLDAGQMARLDALDSEDGRVGPHPANFC
ncbi:aldo/keto reductase [Sphingomicrobium lutaoense]|uniref:2,5-diketo-D-gluconate reductase A n=1 Tax=Sphingomicrobium lutaoense TaxID=515949 RepID=A0A839Z0M7_9SPHN|nr:aldo/keto reductase [Sphingomicrobium lutaoense]MBB3763115.1 2,5-diketo-D-gluconate reductase A [Sphingomicrobium lutaoense]